MIIPEMEIVALQNYKKLNEYLEIEKIKIQFVGEISNMIFTPRAIKKDILFKFI